MQGRKSFHPQLFYQLSLEELVPSDNYYRHLKGCLGILIVPV